MLVCMEIATSYCIELDTSCTDNTKGLTISLIVYTQLPSIAGHQKYFIMVHTHTVNSNVPHESKVWSPYPIPRAAPFG